MGHWTDTHPDRTLWSPGRLAVARTQTEEEYEALYGRAQSMPPLTEIPAALARRGSYQFLLQLREHLPAETTPERVRQDPLFRTFLDYQEDPGHGWRQHFQEECVRGILGQAELRPRETVLWQWSSSIAREEFFTKARQYLDDIHSESVYTTRLQISRKARMWLKYCEAAARSSDPNIDSEELLWNQGGQNPLIRLDELAYNLIAAEGYEPVSQQERQDYLLREAPFSWAGEAALDTAYVGSELGGVGRRQGELSAAAFAALLQGSANMPALLDLRDAITRSLELGCLEPEQMADGWQCFFGKADLKKISSVLSCMTPGEIANALCRAGEFWNSSWTQADRGPVRPPSSCLRKAFLGKF